MRSAYHAENGRPSSATEIKNYRQLAERLTHLFDPSTKPVDGQQTRHIRLIRKITAKLIVIIKLVPASGRWSETFSKIHVYRPVRHEAAEPSSSGCRPTFFVTTLNVAFIVVIGIHLSSPPTTGTGTRLDKTACVSQAGGRHLLLRTDPINQRRCT